MKEMFDFNNIEDFDKHIRLSIPNYHTLFDIFQSIALEFMPPDGRCIDLGCSTGKFLNKLSSNIPAEYIGVDIVNMPSDKNFLYIKDDLVDTLKLYENCDLIVSMFTLQFLGKYKRQQALTEIKRLVNNGSRFLIAEKVYFDSSKLNSVLQKQHYKYKRNFFTDKEILDKDYSLLGSMHCLYDWEVIDQLNEIGYVEQVWQSYNFKGWFVEPL
ncbi:MAG: methyltransferase domain-containing protein [archaeon]